MWRRLLQSCCRRCQLFSSLSLFLLVLFWANKSRRIRFIITFAENPLNRLMRDGKMRCDRKITAFGKPDRKRGKKLWKMIRFSIFIVCQFVLAKRTIIARCNPSLCTYTMEKVRKKIENQAQKSGCVLFGSVHDNSSRSRKSWNIIANIRLWVLLRRWIIIFFYVVSPPLPRPHAPNVTRTGAANPAAAARIRLRQLNYIVPIVISR